MIEVQGRICRIRQLSKRLIFYDLLLIDSSGLTPDTTPAAQPKLLPAAVGGAAAAVAALPAAAAASVQQTKAAAHDGEEERWLEVVAKESEYPDVQLARDTMRIGDIVCFQGDYQDAAHSMLTCRGFKVLVHWKDVSGGRSFQPRAPPVARHGTAATPNQQQKQKQQETAQQQQQQQQQGGVPPRLCKFFVNSGQCLKGDSCPFVHGDASQRGAALAAWVKRRRAERRENAQREGCVHVAGASSKRYRARIFAQWLVDKFGKEALNKGAGVLDIAGGRGAMTFELVTTHGVRCTLVEPRPLRLDKHQHRTLRTLGLRAEITRLIPPGLETGGATPAAATAAAMEAGGGGGRANGSAAAAAATSVDEDCQEDVAWWREEEEEEEEEAGGSESDSSSSADDEGLGDATASGMGPHENPREAVAAELQFEWLAAMRRNAAAAVVGEGPRSSSLAQAPPTEHKQQQQQQHQQQRTRRIPKADRAPLALCQVQSLFGPALWTSDWFAANGLSSPSLIIGLHPDEATDPIVDYAMLCTAPFAVVPCCVFPRKFPHRRRRVTGGVTGAGDAGDLVPVVTYPELVEYLLQKGEARCASEEPLAFQGCNRVVWAPAAAERDSSSVRVV